MVLFEERQKFNQAWLWALLIGVGTVVAITAWPDLSVGRLGPHLFGICAYLLVVSGMAAVTLRTRLYPDRLEVAFLPFTRRTIRKQDVDRAYLRDYSPLTEYGGWGYRTGRSGTAYNTSGDQGLQLELVDGKRVLIGTQNVAALRKALATWKPG